MYDVPFLEKTCLFTSIDIQFAGFMGTLSRIHDTAVVLGAALASRNIRNGDVCIDLPAYAGGKIHAASAQKGDIKCPDLKKWREALLKSGIVGEPGDYKPMVLDEKNRLYLYRYWEYEKILGDALLERAALSLPAGDADTLRNSLDRFFPKDDDSAFWQKTAAMVATLKPLCVISGGPGTGKTFAVARMLAFLVERHLNTGGDLTIYLAAPTGKAAARLTESISLAKESLPCTDHVKNAIPDNGLTIHRLLKSQGQTSRFHFHAGNRLPADVVVVDEASMVDLPLMSKLVQALSSTTRLIMLGDADQLASVEAGSVLGDICGKERVNQFSFEFINHIKSIDHVSTLGNTVKTLELPGLHDSRVHFQKSFRFDENSGILQLSRLVNQGRDEEVLRLLSEGRHDDVSWFPISGKESLLPLIDKQIVHHYVPLVHEKDPAKALHRMNRFKILCALNQGPFGVQGINRMVAGLLARSHRKGRVSIDAHPTWYHGRPVLIRKNDYQLELFNGDMGIVMQDPGKRGELSVFFAMREGKIRSIAPYRLPEHETAYAMTVHKSQGSEFDEVMMVLPEYDTPVLTRELIYTGMTRARRNLSILSSESAIRHSVSRRIERTSGLRDRLSVHG